MLRKTFLTLCAFLGVAKSQQPINSYGTPLAPPINDYGNNNDHHDHSQAQAYEFGYQVKDDYTGNNYNRKEASDGNQVRGEYRVQLPDGRTQIVTYYADWQSGFHADVRYEGVAQYPEQYNTFKPNPQYGPPAPNGGGSATSSVHIKDYSANNNNYNNNYDSYNNNFGNKGRPGYEYGAP